MKLLITGGCGFLGSNLASEALRRGCDLTILDNLSRSRAKDNLAWIEAQGRFRFVSEDIRNASGLSHLVAEIRPDVIFHLAGQVAMTTSIANPRLDFEVNALGSHNVLEAVRLHAPEAIVVYSSTNKVYGDLEQYTYAEGDTRYDCREHPNGFDEHIPLDFRSPYGCSKGSADQYMLDYARIYQLRTVVFRHSSMYGGRQYPTFDQGWVAWFCLQAVEAAKNRSIAPFTISGNGKQVRDVLHADDMIQLYFLAADKIGAAAGQAFNIGGGKGASLSLLELFGLLEAELRIKLNYEHLPARVSDQRVFIANIGKASNLLGWQPQVASGEGIARMVNWLQEES